MTATAHPVEAEDHHEHVSDWVYIKIALILAFLTAIEVFTYFESVHKMSDELLILVLSTLMVVKFFFVAAYFMHLKYDTSIFTKMIVSGMLIAYPVYCVFAFAMGWLPGWNVFVKIGLMAIPPIVAGAWLMFDWNGPEEETEAH